MPDGSKDAFDVIGEQDRLVGDLIAAWRDNTDRLQAHDSVDLRSQRGSDTKLLLQHLAVREEAIEEVGSRLRQLGHDELSAQLQGDGEKRREAIGRLDLLVRGHQAMNVNNPDVTEAVGRLAEIVTPELGDDRGRLLDQVGDVLGGSDERDLPSARHVRTHSPTVPSPTPRWYDRVGPLKALRALYDHLRSTPSSGTTPSVDGAREHTPGVRD